MSKQTCEIDGKIFEAAPCRDPRKCDGCVGENYPGLCRQLASCLPRDIIWVEAACVEHQGYIRDGKQWSDV